MLERVRDAHGEVFRPVRAYRDDLKPYWGRIGRFDKLERLQHFREPDDPSWAAFAAGRWRDAQRIMEQNYRPQVMAEFADDASSGLVSYRVRVVEFPVMPYLQWELHALKMRAECGENIRVVGPEKIAPYEEYGVVPELIFMDVDAMYEVLYDETGVLAGGRKFTDSEMIRGCLSDVRALYEQGEDLRTFFEREIAPLPSPAVDPESSPSSGS